ncbi:hypothetical protein Poly59_15400 [Rubripirellula reticaptiva]|uniref:Uncharacterized protein n=1 Tax=Rubripirellula reticaptiva TaxID=2528013 RepID=A0A5C6F036_9BACT|nr:hypothetical protein Poly59_15400 [Rubripirellula reticaptiva]
MRKNTQKCRKPDSSEIAVSLLKKRTLDQAGRLRGSKTTDPLTTLCFFGRLATNVANSIYRFTIPPSRTTRLWNHDKDCCYNKNRSTQLLSHFR